MYSLHLFCGNCTAILCQSENATKVNLSQTFEPISWLHLLGTDDYGRDLFTRIIIGARSTLFVTVLTLIAIVAQKGYEVYLPDIKKGELPTISVKVY